MIILNDFPDNDGRFSIPRTDLRHLLQVLRQKPAEPFEVILPDGRRGLARLDLKGEKDSALLFQVLDQQAPASLSLWLVVALIRWPRLEWLVEKATELGVQRLTPLLSARCRQKIEGKKSLKIDRLRRISQETLKQVGRPTPLQIDEIYSFKEFLKSSSALATETQRLLFNPRCVKPLLQEVPLSSEKLTVIAIGPEGDFSEQEIQELEASGFASVSLGSSVFRAETAALYGTCFIHSLRKT